MKCLHNTMYKEDTCTCTSIIIEEKVSLYNCCVEPHVQVAAIQYLPDILITNKMWPI